VQCLADADCPATGNDCVLAQCTNGACGTTNAPAGTSCNNGNGVCNGAGICEM
jgi:hypothetical protein